MTHVKQYRKNPGSVEALLVEAGYKNINDIIEFVGSENMQPIERRPDYILKIKTLEGDMSVNYGDYIVKGAKGEFYPVKADIFTQIYTPVESVDN